eukprot:m.48742 g.48742  ORF g.48742 m.48742 type:complete len:650 (-) comp12021_c0_seq2:83-2032(-)
MALPRRRVVLHINPRRPLGFQLDGHAPAQIVRVAPNSTADESGLRPGDVILTFNGVDCSHATQDQLAQAFRTSGNVVELLCAQMGRAQAVALRNGDTSVLSGRGRLGRQVQLPMPYLPGGVGRYSKQALLVLPLWEECTRDGDHSLGPVDASHPALYGHTLNYQHPDEAPVMFDAQDTPTKLDPPTDVSIVSVSPSLVMPSDTEYEQAVQRTNTLAQRYATVMAEQTELKQLRDAQRLSGSEKTRLAKLETIFEQRTRSMQDVPSEVSVIGREGANSNINGTYRLSTVLDRRPIFLQRGGRDPLYLYFNEQSVAWTLAQSVDGTGMAAFCGGDTVASPERIRTTWCVSVPGQGYVEDKNIRVVIALKKRVSFSDHSGLPLTRSKEINADSPPNSRRGSQVVEEETGVTFDGADPHLAASDTQPTWPEPDVMVPHGVPDPYLTVSTTNDSIDNDDYDDMGGLRGTYLNVAREEDPVTTGQVHINMNGSVDGGGDDDDDVIAARALSPPSDFADSPRQSLMLETSFQSEAVVTEPAVPGAVMDDGDDYDDYDDYEEDIGATTPAPVIQTQRNDGQVSASHLFSTGAVTSSGHDSQATSSSSAADDEWSQAQPSRGSLSRKGSAAKEAARIRKDMERQARSLMRTQKRGSKR